ncbi:type VII toxin-antitoxin system MntA family adenylyltransferase antitoxin [Desulfoscipio gibsoniae]|uniref:type VII toxin-antitoxin system MntA family adenylyltransferase antitoxin n=1 Tax=Desulfoscipio gibsoniae TaxID=102134 RepID=UPI00031F38CC|nr:nucleotidyltransferase domain-containing protein [Desulfoscipio gibsoniae]
MYRFKKIEHNVMEYIPLLIEKMRIDGDIVAIFLFGSYAEGKQTPVSDIDLAVLVDGDFPPSRYFEKELELLAIITSLLKTDEVDLVILNHAPPALSYRILSKGQYSLVNLLGNSVWRKRNYHNEKSGKGCSLLV